LSNEELCELEKRYYLRRESEYASNEIFSSSSKEAIDVNSIIREKQRLKNECLKEVEETEADALEIPKKKALNERVTKLSNYYVEKRYYDYQKDVDVLSEKIENPNITMAEASILYNEFYDNAYTEAVDSATEEISKIQEDKKKTIEEIFQSKKELLSELKSQNDLKQTALKHEANEISDGEDAYLNYVINPRIDVLKEQKEVIEARLNQIENDEKKFAENLEVENKFFEKQIVKQAEDLVKTMKGGA
jgi:hypothetical protein